jgi:hypothetical protein
MALALFIGGSFGLSEWDTILRWLNRVQTGVSDPILGRDVGFYLFALPLYDALAQILVTLGFIGLIASFVSIFLQFSEDGVTLAPDADPATEARRFRSIFLSVGVILLALGWGKYLARFNLMYSDWGAAFGPGWTDVHVRMPALWLAGAAALVLAVVVLVPALRRKVLPDRAAPSAVSPKWRRLAPTGAGIAVMLLLWFVILNIIPGMVQWLRVEPNEISMEKPYLKHNIDFTRRGFKLHTVEEREFQASDQFTQGMVDEYKSVFDNIRLWDWRALDAVYKQFQEIRLYYEFEDVDIDRYIIDDQYRQVMISARELDLNNLPAGSGTFVNRRFKYTHGYGLTLTTVNEFTPQGLPNLLIKDIPPVSEYKSLEVTQPQIYYGELTETYAVVNSQEQEFDYPKGETNAYIRYPGQGGVQLSSFFRKFLFGWKMGGTKLLLSGYPTSESRIMFHRRIQERVQLLAPFIEFDRDPYVVLIDGRMHWIIDGYTTSDRYPYSEPFNKSEVMSQRDWTLSQDRRLQETPGQINYIRNSVKAVVDAFDGSVDFYIFDEEDPLIQVWDRVFPGLFQPQENMPEKIRRHVRYPTDMLLIQGLVYAKYHMTDPAVFYNQEDLWVRATEKYYGQVQPVQPYYIMWQLPGDARPEFVLILPFTPKNRQVMIGWIAGMCDGDNYGRFLAYKFPKEKRVLGPQQVETKIDQDPFLSGQLTLWDQRGSRVIRGNVLAIPIGETILYVEPVYLQAETAAYPELRLVMVMHEDDLSYAESFDEALAGLFEDRPPEKKAQALPGQPLEMGQLIDQAGQYFDQYLNHLGNKEFGPASDALQNLSDTLNRMAQQSPDLAPEAETEQ